MSIFESFWSLVSAGLLLISRGENNIQLQKGDFHRSLKETSSSHGGIKYNPGYPLFSKSFPFHTKPFRFSLSFLEEEKKSFFKSRYNKEKKGEEKLWQIPLCQISVKNIKSKTIIVRSQVYEPRDAFENFSPQFFAPSAPLKECQSNSFLKSQMREGDNPKIKIKKPPHPSKEENQKSQSKNLEKEKTNKRKRETGPSYATVTTYPSLSHELSEAATFLPDDKSSLNTLERSSPPFVDFGEQTQESFGVNENFSPLSAYGKLENSSSLIPEEVLIEPFPSIFDEVTSENNNIPPPPPPPLPFLMEGDQKPFCLRKKPQLEDSEKGTTNKRKRDANQQDDLMEALKKKLKARIMQQIPSQEGPSSDEPKRETQEDRWAKIERLRLDASRASNENAPKKPMWYKGKYITPDDPHYKLACEIYLNTQKSHLKTKKKASKKKELSTKAEQVRKLCASQAKKWDGKSMSEILKGLSALKLRKAKQNSESAEDQNAQLAQTKEPENLQDKLIRELENKLKKRKPRGPIFIHRSPPKNKQKSPLKFQDVLKKRAPLITVPQSQSSSENSLEKMASLTLENTSPLTPVVTVPSPIKLTSPATKKVALTSDRKSRAKDKENQNPNTRVVSAKIKREDTITKQKNKLKRPLIPLTREFSWEN